MARPKAFVFTCKREPARKPQKASVMSRADLGNTVCHAAEEDKRLGTAVTKASAKLPVSHTAGLNNGLNCESGFLVNSA